MSDPRLVFTFHNCLGEGGYGEVYLATQHTEGGITRDVAVKVLHERFDDGSDAVKRLRDEGQALALLAHPSILSVHEFARVDGRLALVTEYVEGVDLSYFCTPDRLLPEKVALEVLRDVAEALAFAQTTVNPLTGNPLGLIHRDVKPANVRLSVDGKVKLLDFGVARSGDMSRHAKTAMGDVLLTPGYGSPEALAFGVSGPSVDVFALAASAFELFTGTTYYGASDLQYQLSLALDSEDYSAYLEQRLATIEKEPIRQLLREMLVFAHESRITAREASDRADELWEKASGPALGRWSRNTEFPDLSNTTAELCGRKIDAEGMVGTPAVPNQTRRTAPADSMPPPATGFGSTLDLTSPPPPPRAPNSLSPLSPSMATPPPAEAVKPSIVPVEAPRPKVPKKRKKKGNMLPWVLAGAAVLLGGAAFVVGLGAFGVLVALFS